MKQINLVPPAVRQKAATRQAVPYLVVAALVGIMASGTAWGGFTYQLNALKQNKDQLVAQQQAQDATNAKLEATTRVDADLTNRVSQINALAKNDVDWNKAFAYVAALIPQDVNLSNYSLGTGQASTVLLKITGNAPTNVSYATFAQYLTQSTGKVITSFKVEGYSYEPATGKVTFSMTISVPKAAISFPAS